MRISSIVIRFERIFYVVGIEDSIHEYLKITFYSILYFCLVIEVVMID